MPRYIRVIQDVDQEWMVQGYCRHDDGKTNVAWSVRPGETVSLGGSSKYLGSELIAYAEAVCEMCPVQWQCARFAIQTEVGVGTWGMGFELLKWLRESEHEPLAAVDAADAEDVPVQVAIRRLRAGLPLVC